MRRSYVELGNKPLTAFSQNEDFAVLDMYYGRVTSVHHNKHYTGKFLVAREIRPTRNKLERGNQEGFREDGTCLGGVSISSSQQTRMASACGTMHPLGCRMNPGSRFKLTPAQWL